MGWLLAIPLFTGSGFASLCDLTGLVVASFVNFILPPCLYLLCVRQMNGMSKMVAVSDTDESLSADDETAGDPVLDTEDSESEPLIEMSEIEYDPKAGVLQCSQVMDVQDSDFAKKNKWRWTRDVVQAVICVVVATALSTAV